MRLISQIISKLSPPVFTVGEVKKSRDKDWHVNLEPYAESDDKTAYRFNFEIPYDSDIKTIQGQKGEQGNAATISIGNVSIGDKPSVINTGTSNAAILDIVLPRGAKGEKGNIGPQGPMGLTGPQGAAGSVPMVKVGKVDYSNDGLVHVLGRYEERFDKSKETLIDFYFPRVIMDATDNVGVIPTVTIGEVTAGDIAKVTNVGTNHDAILDIVLPKGAKGEKGDTGIQGVPGIQGPPGPNGITPTITIGKVVEGEKVNIVNVGTSTDLILDITMPKGLKGEKGDTGLQGERGPQGPRGERGFQGEQGIPGISGAPGKSAYEIAVEKGFTGSEDDWLAHLKEYTISLELGDVTVGTEPDVSLTKTSDTSYKINFVLPDTSADTFDISEMTINATNILFNDGSSLQDKYDTGDISTRITSLPYAEIGTVSSEKPGSEINDKVTINGMSIVSYLMEEQEYKGIWFKYDNARLGFYLTGESIGIYLDIGTIVE